MSVRDTIRRRIDERAAAIRRERAAGAGFWAQLRSWLAGVDKEAEREAERKRDEREAAQTRANRAFPAQPARVPGGDEITTAGYKADRNSWM